MTGTKKNRRSKDALATALLVAAVFLVYNAIAQYSPEGDVVMEILKVEAKALLALALAVVARITLEPTQ